MQLQPTFSIITITYNAVRLVEQTLLNVLSQSYPNIEYIVIDGGSTDGTVDIIRRYESGLAYWVSEPDKGIYDAMNKGLQKGDGRLCLVHQRRRYPLFVRYGPVGRFQAAEEEGFAGYHLWGDEYRGRGKAVTGTTPPQGAAEALVEEFPDGDVGLPPVVHTKTCDCPVI